LPATLDDRDRSIDVVWSTGARVRRQPFFGEPFDEELSMDPRHVRLERLNGGAPLLKVHDRFALESVIGSVVPGTARVENGRGVARVRFSDREDVAPIWTDIRDGHIRAVSIGYQVQRYEISKPANSPELWRAVDWTPFEISAVPVGADPAAGFRSVDPVMPCIVTRDDAPNARTLSMDKTDNAPAAPAAEIEDEAPPVPPAKETGGGKRARAAERIAEPLAPAIETRQREQAAETEALVTRTQEAERARIGTIYDLAARLGLERTMAEDLVSRGVAIDEARRVILDKVAENSERTRTFPHVSVPLGGRDERVTRRDAVANALLHRYSPTLFQLSEPAREYRGMTLLELAREFLGSAGVNVRGFSRDEIATRALHSTSDFPEVLSAVTNKTLRQAYEVYPRTFVPFCRQVLATDFKAMNRVQIGEAPQLLKVNESGEFKRGTIAESKESYRIETYGRVVGVTRQLAHLGDIGARRGLVELPIEVEAILPLFGDAAGCHLEGRWPEVPHQMLALCGYVAVVEVDKNGLDGDDIACLGFAGSGHRATDDVEGEALLRRFLRFRDELRRQVGVGSNEGRSGGLACIAFLGKCPYGDPAFGIAEQDGRESRDHSGVWGEWLIGAVGVGHRSPRAQAWLACDRRPGLAADGMWTCCAS
jgi:hypothetical protein